MIYVMSGSGGGGLNGVALIWCEFPTDADSVTCSNGTKTYTVPAKWLSSGGYCFAVNAVGEWTLTAKKGTTDTDTATVNVQAGQRYTVVLQFEFVLFEAGTGACVDFSKSCRNDGARNAYITWDNNAIVFNATDGIDWTLAALNTNSKIDITPYTRLFARVEYVKQVYSNHPYFNIGVRNSKLTYEDTYMPTCVSANASTSLKEYFLDVSQVNSEQYVCVAMNEVDAKITKLSLKK